MWLDSLKAAGYSPNTLNTRRCQMSALSRALEGDPRDVEGDDLLAHFAGKEWKPETRKGAKNACVVFCQVGVCVLCSVFPQCRQRVFRRVCGIGRCLS
ncbi:MAG: hypothetical protein E7C65_09450, partial [Bifidobacterium longum]|nr:hypothetical protein [Bifidobacterium longum]